jgi:phage repressor protein C with HTH and peptisase S24 domain
MTQPQAPHEGELLKEAIRKSKITQEEFANERMGFSRNYFLRICEKQILPNDFKLKAIEALGYNPFENVNHQVNEEVVQYSGPSIPVYDIAATASNHENTSQIPEVPSYKVRIPGYEDCNFGMYVYGHSMYPTLESGSLVLCRRVIDKDVIMYGEIYLIRTHDYLMVKRLQRNEKKGYVLCTSDNYEQRNEKFKRFEPFDMHIDKIIDLYLVKGIIKKTQT